MKKIVLSIAIVGSLIVAGSAHAAGPRDCDANAIMWCGAYTKTEFAYKVAGGDQHNSPQNLQAIYNAFSIGLDEMKLASDGYVAKDGRVVVNGKTVATGASSIGRQYMPGSVKKHGVWLRSTQDSFKSDRLDAFVYMKDDVFQWAVLKSCGNAVTAMAIAKPKPQPPIKPSIAPPPAPVAPVLPETGMELPVAAAFGTTSIGYGVRHYLRSRRLLARALRRK
jgi:hypothetical protein